MATAVELAVRRMPIRLDITEGRLSCGGRSTPVSIRRGRIPLRVLVDRTSIEVFVNDGEITMLLAGAFDGNGVTLTAEGGAAHLVELEVHEVRSAWDR
jgi:sucrose-6-phosphate hydrolase SacC (GH32 family)